MLSPTNKTRGNVQIVVVVFVVVSVIVGVWLGMTVSKDNLVLSENTNRSTLQTYSDAHGFSIQYPIDWTVSNSGSVVIAQFGPAGTTYYIEGSIAYPVYIAAHDISIAEYTSGVSADRQSAITVGANTFTRIAPSGTVSTTSYLIDLPQGSLSVNDQTTEIAATNGLTSVQANALRATFQEMLASLVIDSEGGIGGLSTYSDARYGFSARHPTAWVPEVFTDGYNGEGNYVVAFKTGSTGPSPFIAIKEKWSVQHEVNWLDTVDPPYTKVSSLEEIRLGVYLATRIIYRTTIGLEHEKTIVISENATAYIFDSLSGDTTFRLVAESLVLPTISEALPADVGETTSAGNAGNNLTMAERDQLRVDDVRALQAKLELYWNDHGSRTYPSSSAEGEVFSRSLLPTYLLGTVPVAPLPADGSCTEGSNGYVYKAITNSIDEDACTPDSGKNCMWYYLYFCTGAEIGRLRPGLQVASPSGMSSCDVEGAGESPLSQGCLLAPR